MPANSIGRASAGEDQEQRRASLADHDPATPTTSRVGGAAARDAPPRRRTMPVKIVRDYWAEEDSRSEWSSPANNRIAAGRVVALAVREARRLIETGVAERADPLPEE